MRSVPLTLRFGVSFIFKLQHLAYRDRAPLGKLLMHLSFKKGPNHRSRRGNTLELSIQCNNLCLLDKNKL